MFIGTFLSYIKAKGKNASSVTILDRHYLYEMKEN